EGRFIPDSDELDSTDSFFAPTKEIAPPTPVKGIAQAGATTTLRPIHGAITRVAGTLVNLSTEKPGGGLDQTLPQGKPPRPAESRPAQLIVAMELGHKTLDDRQKQCQADRLPGVPAE